MSRTYIAYDLETTGLLTPDHRILEVYMSRRDLATGEEVDSYYSLVNPGRGIPTEVVRVHGITPARVADAPPFSIVGAEVLRFLDEDPPPFLLGHNAEEFDGPFLEMELARVGMRRKLPPCLDTMKRSRWATPEGRVPNLGALCFACGVPYDAGRAHAADYDVQVMVDCFHRGVAWGKFTHQEFA